MRFSGVCFLIPLALAAQSQRDSGLVRGTLLECETNSGGGDLSVRTVTNEVFRFRFDLKTYFERESQRIQGAGLKAGELVEVVADHYPGTMLRYARTVHVIEPPKRERPLSAGRFRAFRSPIESLVPTGNLTFSGIVFRVGDGQLALHLRDGANKTFLLRQDTRYLDGGSVVDSGSLKTNMRVFVRAGKDLYGEIEAYQVIWGEILRPGEP